MTEEPKDRRALLIAAVLALVSLALYWNVLGHQFLNYDDPDYLTQNPKSCTSSMSERMVSGCQLLETGAVNAQRMPSAVSPRCTIGFCVR